MHNAIARPRRAQQSGMVMLFALIALVIMLVGSIAVMRSLNVSLFNVGNIAFKRDMSNQAERVLNLVLSDMQGTGDLATSADRANHDAGNNYRASMLATNEQGIPTALLASDEDFAAYGSVANDIDVSDQKISIRYVVDRLCDGVGEDAVLGSTHCVLSEVSTPVGGNYTKFTSAETSSGGNKGAVPPQVVYRVSIRVTGPRNTLSFFQTTFSL